VNLGDSLRSYLILVGAPLAITLPATIVLWLVAGQPVPETLLLPIAIVAAPTLWLGLVLAILLTRYTLALNRAANCRLNEEAGACDRALRRLDRAYRMREWLARSHMGNAVYLGYLIKHLQLRIRITGHPLNPYRGNLEEDLQERRRRQQELMSRICQFVYISGTVGRDRKRADDALFDIVALVPSGPGRKVLEDVVFSAYEDGPGFLSTLTATTYLHYLVALPRTPQAEVEKTLTALEFDVDLYGWLSNRVFEAVLYLVIRGRRESQQIVAEVQPLLDQITREVSVCITPSDIGEAKWRGRQILRQSAGILT